VIVDAVATPGLPLDHVPPEVGSVNVIELPAQTVAGPEIVEGEPFTVTTMLTAAPHPLL
jgi:hypothetical protein